MLTDIEPWRDWTLCYVCNYKVITRILWSSQQLVTANINSRNFMVIVLSSLHLHL